MTVTAYRHVASPAARRLMAERGLDPAAVDPGPSGRVHRRDVVAALERPLPGPTTAPRGPVLLLAEVDLARAGAAHPAVSPSGARASAPAHLPTVLAAVDDARQVAPGLQVEVCVLDVGLSGTVVTVVPEPPVGAVLAVGAVTMRPVAVPDGDGAYGVAVHPTATLALTVAATVEVGQAARFLQAVVDRLGRWEPAGQV